MPNVTTEISWWPTKKYYILLTLPNEYLSIYMVFELYDFIKFWLIAQLSQAIWYK